MNVSFRAFLVLLAFLGAALGQIDLGGLGTGRQVTPSLVANTTAVVAGKPFTVLIQLRVKDGWHVYWQYGGDAGLPPSANWQLPEGFTAGPIQWPLPTKHFDPDSDQTSYVYEHEVLLPVEIAPPAQITSNEVSLKAKLSWLVCEKICIPGQGDVSITLPVAAQAAEANAELFSTARSRLPKTDPPPFRATWDVKADAVTVTTSGLPKDATVEFFPRPPSGVRPGLATVEGPNQKGDRIIRFRVKSGGAPDTVWQGLLLTRSGEGPRSGWMLASSTSSTSSGSVVRESSAPPLATGESQNIKASTSNPLQDRSFLTWLGIAFLGGLVLNLMPCVLPVISLKIFGFVSQASEEPRRVLRLGISFAAGVYVFFLALAIVAIILGKRFLWGMQFGDPRSVLVLIALTLIFALAMFGMFEITLGGSVENTLGTLSRKEGYTGAFLQGLFATLLGTSCTAPFVGPALGFVVGKPAPIVLSIFMVMATGLCLPYMLLAANPKWLRFVPKPGAWMEHFKHFMGFVLLAVVAWLFGIFAHEREAGAVSAAGWFFVCLALACWIYGLGKRSAKSLVLSLLIVFVAGWLFVPRAIAQSGTEKDKTARLEPNELGIVWEPFSPERIDQAVKANKPVFIDFTAEWCWNCKAIEAAVINTAPIAAAFKEKGVVTIKADWTRFPPVITEWLNKFNRIGVPVYVLYRPGEAQPIILPDVPTQSGLLDELNKINLGK
jgi:thiol:disulfide interchange protein/DsbC/DsbD-like thiol-disulfide interchange protein